MALTKLKKAGIYTAFAAGAAVLAAPAIAEDRLEASYTKDQPQTLYVDNLFDAGLQSRQYARENDAIGMVISYGAYNGAPSPIDVGEKFKEEILKRGEQSKYFIVPADTPGYAIAFDNPYVSSEPMTLSDAAGSISKIVAEKQRMGGYLASVPSTEFE